MHCCCRESAVKAAQNESCCIFILNSGFSGLFLPVCAVGPSEESRLGIYWRTAGRNQEVRDQELQVRSFVLLFVISKLCFQTQLPQGSVHQVSRCGGVRRGGGDHGGVRAGGAGGVPGGAGDRLPGADRAAVRARHRAAVRDRAGARVPRRVHPHPDHGVPAAVPHRALPDLLHRVRHPPAVLHRLRGGLP